MKETASKQASNPKSDGVIRETALSSSLGLLAVLSALCYAFGYVIVSLYWSTWGILTFDVIRTQYMVAGVWFFTPIIFAAIVILSIIVLEKLFRLDVGEDLSALIFLILTSVMTLSVVVLGGISVFAFN